MLRLESISHAFGDRQALSAVSAEFASGQLVAVVGRNGSGKSTLLRAMAGLLRTDGGRSRWNDCDLARTRARERARRVAFVPQQPGLAIDLSVEEVVALGVERRLRDAQTRGRVDGAIEAAGLTPLRRRAYHGLSSGERQSCVLARAFAQHRPDGLLVLDEPCANLDPAQTRRILSCLRARASQGALVIAAMHDLMVVERVADRVLWLDRGAVVAIGPPREALDLETLARVFGCPFGRVVDALAPDL